MLYIEELESKAKPLQIGGFRECEEYIRIVHEFYCMRISHMRVKWNEIPLPILRRLGGFGTNNSY